jgi:hypothetical protein
MRPELIQDLLEAFEGLNSANLKLRTAVSREESAKLWLPSPYNGQQTGAHATVANALTRLWHQDKDVPAPPSGLLCGTDRVISTALALNEAKEGFRMALNAIRDETNLGNQRRKLVFNAIRKRDPTVAEALETVGVMRLDLNYVDQRVLVLPHEPLSIGWTWARSHQKIRSFSRDEAVELAEQQESDEIREIALKLLAKLPDTERLAEVIKKNHQLRANIKYREGKEIKRRSLVTASVLISPGSSIPPIRWPETPDASPSNRLRRSDATIDPEPYIKPLHLHLYKYK